MGFFKIIKAEEIGNMPADRRKPFPAVHRMGLPIADGAKVRITMLSSRFVFSSESGDTWDLPKERITGIETLKESEIQTHLKNRPGMALLGGVTLGVVGAIVGGAMTKEKKSRVVTQFVVFDYKTQEGEPATLVFQFHDAKVGNADWQKPKLFVKDFQANRNDYATAASYTL
jgi:hypothetical protein